MSNIIGIDLGTTMSAIAKLNSVGKPEIIANSEGERITPSVVLFKSNNEIKTGKAAKSEAGNEPENVAKEFKREMENTDYNFSANGKSFSAPELSSFILKKLVKDASKVESINDVVISVPAYFKELQRDATIEAGKLAGLNVLNIINEPTAAALYYATVDNVNGKCLVYDLGGGTFDVTIIDINGQNSDVITSVGDARLGGIDFDKAMLEIFKEKYSKETGGSLFDLDDKGEYEDFLLLAEEVKKKLSFSGTVKQKLKGEDGRCNIIITEDEFEEKISTYISRTEMLVEQALEEADLEPSEIKNILLVGGSTRIPAIKNSIKEIMGQEAIEKVNVDEAVALGAAIKAGLVLVNKNPEKVSAHIAKELSSINLKEVSNHSYGTISIAFDEVEKREKKENTIIIPKNSPLPCEKTDTFYTRVAGQKGVKITITQGESEDPEYIDIIHEEEMELPTGRESQQPIEITYSYDENQIMHCVFKDVNADVTKNISLSLSKENVKINHVNDFLID